MESGNSWLAVPGAGVGHDGSAREALGMLLEAWQASGDDEVLRGLLAAAGPIAEMAAARTLRRCGIRDPATRDEALTMVFDHLRRLHATGDERCVAPFRAPVHGADSPAAGEAFIVRLSQDRARDAAKAFRRRAGRCAVFSQLEASAGVIVGQRRYGDGSAADAPAGSDDGVDRLREAIDELEPRQRAVVGLLLEGKSQAVIAHVLGVCEGTVSRIRRQAIEQLRLRLAPGGNE